MSTVKAKIPVVTAIAAANIMARGIGRYNRRKNQEKI
jgi:hypothetical protein